MHGPMRKFVFSVAAPFAVLSAGLGLEACSPKAQNEAAEASDAAPADTNAAMAAAVNDVDAAGDRAIGGSDDASGGNLSQTAGNAADDEE